MITLKPSELKQALKVCIKAKRAAMVHGNPGVGKSEVIMQTADQIYAKEYGYSVDPAGQVFTPAGNPIDNSPTARPWFRDIRTALLDAVDMRGVPHVQLVAGSKTLYETLWAIPNFWPTDKRGGVINFDEINRGPELTVNGCFSLVLTGNIGEYQLPASWTTCAAINDLDIGARKLSAALNRRFTHLEAVADLDDVLAYAIAKEWHPLIVAFLRHRPDLLESFDAKARVSPNPRGWEFVSQLMKESGSANPTVMKAMYQGNIGDGAAIELWAFAEMHKNLVSLDQIIADPDNAPLLKEPNLQYAIACGLARRISASNIKAVFRYWKRMPIEWQTYAIKTMAQHHPELNSTKETTGWLQANAAVAL